MPAMSNRVKNLILSKGLKRPDTKSSKIAGLSKTFFSISCMSDHRTLICRLTCRKDPSEFGCRFGWYFYRSKCYNCSCFCTNERDRLHSDQFKGGNVSSQLRQFVYFQSCFENVHTRRSRDTV